MATWLYPVNPHSIYHNITLRSMVTYSLYNATKSSCNSYTMAARDFADIYTQSPRAAGPRAVAAYVSKIPSSHGTSDIYHLGRTHLIGERTNKNSSHLFDTVASEDRLWF